MKITRGELKKIIAEEIEEAEIDEGLMDVIRSLPGMGGGSSRDVWSYNHAKSGKYELSHKNQPLVPGHNPNGFNLGDIQLHLKKALRGAYGDIDPQSLSIKSLESQAASSYPFDNAGEVGEILRKQIDQGGDYGLRTDPFYKALKKKQDAEDSTRGIKQGIEKATKKVGQTTKEVAKDTQTLDQQFDALNKEIKESPVNIRAMNKQIQKYQAIALEAGRTSPLGKQAIQKDKECFHCCVK